MRLVEIKNQDATVKITTFECFRLARILDRASRTGNSVLDMEFAETYAGLFAAAGMAGQLNADAEVAHAETSLKAFADKFGPEDVRVAAD